MSYPKVLIEFFLSFCEIYLRNLGKKENFVIRTMCPILIIEIYQIYQNVIDEILEKLTEKAQQSWSRVLLANQPLKSTHKAADI